MPYPNAQFTDEPSQTIFDIVGALTSEINQQQSQYSRGTAPHPMTHFDFIEGYWFDAENYPKTIHNAYTWVEWLLKDTDTNSPQSHSYYEICLTFNINTFASDDDIKTHVLNVSERLSVPVTITIPYNDTLTIIIEAPLTMSPAMLLITYQADIMTHFKVKPALFKSATIKTLSHANMADYALDYLDD